MYDPLSIWQTEWFWWWIRLIDLLIDWLVDFDDGFDRLIYWLTEWLIKCSVFADLICLWGICFYQEKPAVVQWYYPADRVLPLLQAWTIIDTANFAPTSFLFFGFLVGRRGSCFCCVTIRPEMSTDFVVFLVSVGYPSFGRQQNVIGDGLNFF